MITDGKEALIEYLTTIAEDDDRSTEFILTKKEAEEVIELTTKNVTDFDKNNWQFLKLFDDYEAFLNYWNEITVSEDALKGYLEFTSNENAKESIAEYLAVQYIGGMWDGYYLTSGRIVLFK